MIQINKSYYEYLVFLPFLLYAYIFCISNTNVSVLIDETYYLRQALAFSEGQTHTTIINPVTNESELVRPSDYPPGTSIIASLFMYNGNWTNAFYMPILSLLLIHILLFVWLRKMSLSAFYSLILYLFPPILIMSRVVSSDMISALIIVIIWKMYFTCKENKYHSVILIIGFLSGLSLIFRETNILFIAPLMLLYVLRKDSKITFVITGFVIALSIKLFLSYILFNDPFYLKDPEYGFSIYAVPQNAIIYFPILLLFFPGAIIFPFLYKGKHRIEILTTVIIVIIFFLSYDFRGQNSGLLKSLIIAPRFFIPLIPILIISIAHYVDHKFRKREEILKYIYLVILLASLGGVITVMTNYNSWLKLHQEIAEVIKYEVPTNANVIYNEKSTSKYLSELSGHQSFVHFEHVNKNLLKNNQEYYIVFLQRSDSNFWIDVSDSENNFLRAINSECKFKKKIGNEYVIKIYKKY